MHVRSRTLLPLTLLLMSGVVHAYSFQMDTFAVWKNFNAGSINTPSDLLNPLLAPPNFYDNFADLNAPPSAPNFTPLGGGGATEYAMFGTMGPEAVINNQGILTLDSLNTTLNNFGTPVQQAILKTNVDPNSTAGLKQGSTNFAVGGIFNFINPGNAKGSYGIRFTDASVGNGNDIVSLSIHGRINGKAVIQFSDFDSTTGTRTVISQQVLDSSHQQIGLGLAYLDPAGAEPKAVYATYFYLDNDAPTAFFGMNGSAVLFDGENFTRAALFAADTNTVAVPEPAEYALMLAGLGLVAWAVRRGPR